MRTKPNSQLSNCLRFAKAWSLAALISTAAWAAPAEVTTFTGGDPGEGLDLQGIFTYAVNVGPSGAAGAVGDANFTADSVAGVTVEAGNNIGNGGWLEANYGDTQNDNNLEFVMNSIRWSAALGAPPAVTVRLRVETGIEYKLQLLFGEDCCIGRGFNVLINGNTEAINLMPGVLQTPGGDFILEKELSGVVLTYTFTSPSNELVIVLDGNAADAIEIDDRNAIINGLTLERLSPVTDADGDGLRDDWEIGFFGDLAQAGAGDFDTDGLSNLQEFTAETDPTDTDSDNDSLPDGAEVQTHQTNPSKSDTDDDGLTDGDELNRYLTDATKADTDGDTVTDFDELRLLSDPKSAQSKPAQTTIGIFTGGDPGEGLDLEGTNFLYAIDAGPEASIGGLVGDASFVSEDLVLDGTVATGNKAGSWNSGIVYGDTFNDFALAEIMASISWSDWNRATSAVHISLSNLVVGASYKLQLLFAEQAWPRGFDVFVDGLQVADDFAPVFYQGGGFPLAYPDNQGVVLTHNFVARGPVLSVILDGKGTTTPQFTDHNAIINALTLEQVGAPADTDSDSLPDAWENAFFGNLAQTGSQDADGDTISNETELADGTNPSKADSDNDGLSDAQEKSGTSRAGFSDTDFDGLADGAEATHGSDPTKWDTDSDGISDGYEVNVLQTDPTKALSRAVVQTITGGDTGEGLDLDGTFVYAFSILPDSAAQGQVRDANFTSENVEGVTIGRGPSQAANWFIPDFGTTLNDDTLEVIVQNIRHGGGGIDISLTNLVPGSLYKLQLIFGEQCCARAMDITGDGKVIADDFAPFITMGGINNQVAAAAVVYEFIASTNGTTIRTMNTVTNPRYTDTNPIFNALTLEQIALNADSDGDGLPDPWETYYFSNLTATGTGDPDADGLNNTGEFQFATDPNVADGDGDGLNDNGERTAGSNPSLADTDGDNLLDGAEVNTHQSDPNHHDTDRDGFADASEVARASNPVTADSGTTVGVFTGGDAGEGLDLDGTFVYAFSVLPDTFAIGQVRDAMFTSENVEGVSVAQASQQIPNWYVPEFGSTPNDDVLEQVVQNIRHGNGGATITLSNLVAGNRYKLQLIFGEACCARAMDVSLDGTLIADDFAPYILQGDLFNPAQAAVLTHEFTASSDKAIIRTLGGAAVGIRRFTDTNPIINAVTLESLGAAPPTMRITAFNQTATGFSITFDSVNGRTYVLEYKAGLSDAAWQEAGNVAATGASATITDDNAAHRAAPSGYWRIRGEGLN